MKVTDEMVMRFLGWSLPKDFAPDCGISFTPPRTPHPIGYWPVGTNLFTGDQARAMLEHVLAGTLIAPSAASSNDAVTLLRAAAEQCRHSAETMNKEFNIADTGLAAMAKRIEEFLASPSSARTCIRPDCLDEGGRCNVECPGGEPRPSVSSASSSVPAALMPVLRALAAYSCYACGWSLGDVRKGCAPFDCSFRPSEIDTKYADWKQKAHELRTVLDWVNTPIDSSAKLTNEGGTNG